LVVITAQKLVIKDKVFFATGKSQILARSFALLKQVASVLTAHPDLGRVRVEGHTDDRGAHDANLALSQSRAEAVKAFLSNAGVAASRLEAKGFGPDRPADSNSSEKGRENNRRVEFVVVQE
jgi:outer membrane protein OmpA-like peptidoglycan-associated protein